MTMSERCQARIGSRADHPDEETQSSRDKKNDSANKERRADLLEATKRTAERRKIAEREAHDRADGRAEEARRRLRAAAAEADAAVKEAQAARTEERRRAALRAEERRTTAVAAAAHGGKGAAVEMEEEVVEEEEEVVDDAKGSDTEEVEKDEAEAERDAAATAKADRITEILTLNDPVHDKLYDEWIASRPPKDGQLQATGESEDEWAEGVYMDELVNKHCGPRPSQTERSQTNRRMSLEELVHKTTEGARPAVPAVPVPKPRRAAAKSNPRKRRKAK